MQNEQGKQAITINYLDMFTRSKQFILIVIVTFLTAAASLMFERKQAPVYTATATLIVDFQDPINTTNTRNMLPALLQEEYMATQIGIISSQFMADKVMNDLDKKNNDAIQPIRKFLVGQGEPVDKINSRLSSWLLRNLRVYVHNKSTRLIKIAFQSVSKDRSVTLADAFADNYLDTVLELNQAPIKSSAKWIDESATPIRQALDEAEKKLSERPSSTEIQEVYTLLDTAQNSLNILSSMLNENSMEGVNQRDNQYLQKINIDILENEVLLIDKAREHGERHPEYLSVLRKLRLLKTRLGEVVSQQINSMKTTVNSLNQSLTLRGSVRLSNVTLLNYSSVDISSDETGEKQAILYGAILGFLIGVALAFLSLQYRARKTV